MGELSRLAQPGHDPPGQSDLEGMGMSGKGWVRPQPSHADRYLTPGPENRLAARLQLTGPGRLDDSDVQHSPLQVCVIPTP